MSKRTLEESRVDDRPEIDSNKESVEHSSKRKKVRDLQSGQNSNVASAEKDTKIDTAKKDSEADKDKSTSDEVAWNWGLSKDDQGSKAEDTGFFAAYEGLGFAAHQSKTGAGWEDGKKETAAGDSASKEQDSWLGKSDTNQDFGSDFQGNLNSSWDFSVPNGNDKDAGENWWGTVGKSFGWDSTGDSSSFFNNISGFEFRGEDLEANGEETEEPEEPVEEKAEIEIHNTGENDDESHFSCNAKVFLFNVDENNNKTWKEHARGTLFVNYVPESNIGRLVCRQSGTGMLRLNCPISTKSDFKVTQKDRITFGMPKVEEKEEEEEGKKSTENTEPAKTEVADATTSPTTTAESTSATTKNDSSPKTATAASDHSNKIHLITYCIKASENDVGSIMNAIQKIKTKITESSSKEEKTSA